MKNSNSRKQLQFSEGAILFSIGLVLCNSEQGFSDPHYLQSQLNNSSGNLLETTTKWKNLSGICPAASFFFDNQTSTSSKVVE